MSSTMNRPSLGKVLKLLWKRVTDHSVKNMQGGRKRGKLWMMKVLDVDVELGCWLVFEGSWVLGR